MQVLRLRPLHDLQDDTCESATALYSVAGGGCGEVLDGDSFGIDGEAQSQITEAFVPERPVVRGERR